MNVNIYTASKRWQKIVEAAASVSIVTADEIQKILIPNAGCDIA